MIVPQSLGLDFDALPYEGQSVIFGAPRSIPQSADHTFRICEADKGKVVLIKKIIVQGGGPNNTSPNATGDVGTSALLLMVADGAAATSPAEAVDVSLPFYNFVRKPTLGAGEEQAVPQQSSVWDLSHPIVLPSGWTASFGSDGAAAGTGIAVWGVQVDETTARSMGYDVSTEPLQANRNWITAGTEFPDTNDVTLAAARTGYSILITDIFVRMQPTTNGATITIQDSANADIFVFKSDNITDSFERQIKCRIFLGDGLGLEAVASANAANRGSVCVVGRYVLNDEKPRDAWYSHVVPTIPSPAATAQDYGAVIDGVRAGTTVKAAPGAGFRHIIEGYYISASKDSSVPNDAVIFALTTGASTSGTLGVDTLTIGMTNRALSPLVSLASQSQSVQMLLDQVQIPVPVDRAIFFESAAVPTPSNADADIDGWFCTVWGRTVPSTGSTGDKHEHIRGSSTRYT